MPKKAPADPNQHVVCKCPSCEDDTPLLQDLEGALLDRYADYLGGGWVRRRPEEPGIYAIAALDGTHVGYREFKMREGELIDTLQASCDPGWQGWFWSEPLPPPPKEVPN